MNFTPGGRSWKKRRLEERSLPCDRLVTRESGRTILVFPHAPLCVALDLGIAHQVKEGIRGAAKTLYRRLRVGAAKLAVVTSGAGKFTFVAVVPLVAAYSRRVPDDQSDPSATPTRTMNECICMRSVRQPLEQRQSFEFVLCALTRAGRQRAGNDGMAFLSCCSLQLFNQRRFQIVWIGPDFAGYDFYVRCPVITQFACTQALLRRQRRAKDAASHGSCFVKIAGPCQRIEDRTSLVVGEFSEALFGFVAFIERSSHWIARKIFRQSSYRITRTLFDPLRPLPVLVFQVSQAFLQTKGIQLIDREDANAALRASRTAYQPLAASSCSIGERCVDDLDQLSVVRNDCRPTHTKTRRIAKGWPA